MRNRLMIGAAALLLASATFAGAQDKPQPETTTPSSGTIDIGGRFTTHATVTRRATSATATCATASNANFLYNKETAELDVRLPGEEHRLPRQRYELFFNSSRVKFNATFDQTPLNYAYYSQTPYNCTAGNCSLSSDLRTQVQNGQADRRPAERRPAGHRLGLQLDRERRSTCSRAATRSRPTCASRRPTTSTSSSA